MNTEIINIVSYVFLGLSILIMAYGITKSLKRKSNVISSAPRSKNLKREISLEPKLQNEKFWSEISELYKKSEEDPSTTESIFDTMFYTAPDKVKISIVKYAIDQATAIHVNTINEKIEGVVKLDKKNEIKTIIDIEEKQLKTALSSIFNSILLAENLKKK